MNLQDYVTRNEIISRQNRDVPDKWTIGIDFGFSSVKGFAPNKVFCFTNCAKILDGKDDTLAVDDSDIVLREGENVWLIGGLASSRLSSEEAGNIENDLYGRNRFDTVLFEALKKAGLGIALSGNTFREYRGEPIIVQTGLPPKYLDDAKPDSARLKRSLAGSYDFELKVGHGRFTRFQFEISEENIFLMSQPKGAMFSAISNSDITPAADSMNIVKSKSIVFDPGFMTLDVYDIQKGALRATNTFDKLGMYEILRRTSKDIARMYHNAIEIPDLQEALKLGYVDVYDDLVDRRLDKELENLIEKNTKEVFDDAARSLLAFTNYMRDYRYLIVTGGTGDAWLPAIREKFKTLQHLTVIGANRNDTSLSNIYSNVRGYYLSLVRSVMQRQVRS